MAWMWQENFLSPVVRIIHTGRMVFVKMVSVKMSLISWFVWHYFANS